MDQLQLDVLVTRGSHVESRHQVHAAIVDAQHGLIAGARNTNDVVPWRSCAKPFQLMPLIAAGGLEQLGWGDDQIALACASHGGEPEHVAIASQMLLDLGLEEGDLACGPHEPMARRGAKLLRDAGLSPTRLHNNCSGKHAAMLVVRDGRVVHHECDPALEGKGGYPYPRHQTPWQEMQREIVDQFSEGMVLKPAVKYRDVAHTSGVPRDNH